MGFDDGRVTGLILKENGKFKLGNGYSVESNHVDYVVQDGKIYFGYGHYKLSNGNNVDYAGDIRIGSNDGVITGWSNGSGHFKPDGNDIIGRQKVINLFKQKFGVDLGKYSFLSI